MKKVFPFSIVYDQLLIDRYSHLSHYNDREAIFKNCFDKDKFNDHRSDMKNNLRLLQHPLIRGCESFCDVAG